MRPALRRVQRTGWVLGLLRMASRRGSARQRASAMTGTRFLIPSLLAVGFHNQNPLQAALIDAATTYDTGRGTGSLLQRFHQEIGRASCRESVCQYVLSSVVAVS